MRRVVVTGLGAITPLGVGITPTWRRLLAGASGITSIIEKLAPPATSRWHELSSTVAGMVPAGARDAGEGGLTAREMNLWRASDWLSKSDERRMARFTQYAVAAAEMALTDAAWLPSTLEQREATGVCVGSGIGNLDEIYRTSVEFDREGYKKVSPLFVPQLLINLGAGHISMKYSLHGPNHAVTTACTTGAHAIGDASRFIAFGDADVMLAGGAESCIHPLAFAGFAKSRSLATSPPSVSPTEASRPFDAARSGFVMAEGAALMVLEERAHALRRGAPIYAELVGYGSSADAHHVTAPRADGAGALLAMRRALRAARIPPGAVDYINAHATGTPLGDAAEDAAITTLMLGEEGVISPDRIAVSSTKGAIGHLLGAAGAVEAIFSILAVHENIIPPTLNLHNPSPGFRCNYVPLKAQEKEVNVAISNSFGFGGTNACLAFAKHK